MQPGTLIALAEDRAAELRCEADRYRRALPCGASRRIRLVALLRRRPQR
jgi:hypothetical protein